MVECCEDSLLKKFDYNQDYLWMWNPSRGKSGGILVGIRNEWYDVESFKQGEFMLQMNLWDKLNKVKWNLLVVYGAAQDENKTDFLAELSSFCSTNTEPILIGGDFNIIRFAKEKNTMEGVHRHTPLFNSLIQFYELKEIVMCGGLYTWSNNQEHPTLVKLDRVLVSQDWEDLFPQVAVNRLPREVSDHNPLLITVNKSNALPYIQFRFNLSWLKNPDFFKEVKRIWLKPCRARSALDKIQQKLKLFKQIFKGWGFNLQGELRKQRKKNSDELLELEKFEEEWGLDSCQTERKT
jgi:hypothetical protein